LQKRRAETAPITTDNWPTDPLGWLLSYASRRLREGLAASFAEAGFKISAEQWSILTQLWQEEGLPQQVLADRFHRSKVAAFHLITKLEEQGVVVRRPNPEDGRSNLVYLTGEGHAMVATLIPLAQHNLDRALESIPPEDVETTREVLYSMAVNMTEQVVALRNRKGGGSAKREQ
jgi:DNA-binding MarR family transcriptional regulator